jgi:hypothetical protein
MFEILGWKADSWEHFNNTCCKALPPQYWLARGRSQIIADVFGRFVDIFSPFWLILA